MKIAIFGLARSGLSVLNYLNAKTDHEVYLVNSGEPSSWNNWDDIQNKVLAERCLAEENAAKIFSQMDMIILSPGIPRYHSALKVAISAGVEVISEIEFTFRHSDIPVVAITGTNGKTTTTTMIGEVLAKAGLKVFVCGNIGIPYADLLMLDHKPDYAIVELSSFQLESVQNFHAKIALYLNATDNHAERYKNFNDYKEAKYQIFINQDESDHVIIKKDLDRDSILAKKIYIQALESFDYSQSKMIGEHNKENFFCAYKVCQLLDVENLDVIFQQFINDFTGVELRLQYLREFNGLEIYNDGKSTNTAATCAAVSSFEPGPSLYLALGGQLRSASTDLGEALKNSAITEVLAFGEAKELISEVFEGVFPVRKFNDLRELAAFLKESQLSGNLLFSPAFPSFDQYKNYELRGREFTQLILAL